MQQQSLTDSKVLLLSGKYCLSLNEKRREDACALQKSTIAGRKQNTPAVDFARSALGVPMRPRIAFHRLTRALVCQNPVLNEMDSPQIFSYSQWDERPRRSH